MQLAAADLLTALNHLESDLAAFTPQSDISRPHVITILLCDVFFLLLLLFLFLFLSGTVAALGVDGEI